MRRKGFGKTVLVAVGFWLGLVTWVGNVPPEGIASILVFFVLAFWALWLPLSILFVNGRRGFLITTGILGSLAMKPLGVFSYLSLGAWWAILIVIDVWLSQRD